MPIIGIILTTISILAGVFCTTKLQINSNSFWGTLIPMWLLLLALGVALIIFPSK